jgi:hypothetical protein
VIHGRSTSEPPALELRLGHARLRGDHRPGAMTCRHQQDAGPGQTNTLMGHQRRRRPRRGRLYRRRRRLRANAQMVGVEPWHPTIPPR